MHILLLALLAIPPQDLGRIEGSVVSAGSSQPIANAQVTLSGNAVDIDKVGTFAGNLFNITRVSPDNIVNQITASFNEHFQKTV